MGKMSFLQHTSNADASCIVFCRSQANLLLQERNRKCEAILLKVYDEDGNVFFVWGDYNKFAFKTTYTAVFAGENEIIPPIEDAKPIKVGEAFSHGDNYYVLTQNDRGNLVIRRLNLLCEEKMVRKILSDEDDFGDISEVYLAKIYEINGRKQFLTLAWAVSYTDGFVTYLPILSKDEKLISQYNIAALLKERAVSHLPIKLHEMYYTPVRDVLGKWYIECSKELRLVPMYGVK